MIFHCRENHEDLEETSIESEVFDIDLDDGASEGDDENEGAGSIGEDMTPAHGASAFVTSQVAMPDDVVGSKKCFAFCSKIMELITSLNGKVCQRSNCSEPLHYKESFVGTCFVVSWTCSCGHLGGDGHPNQHVKKSGLATCCLHLQLYCLEILSPK